MINTLMDLVEKVDSLHDQKGQFQQRDENSRKESNGNARNRKHGNTDKDFFCLAHH